MPTLPTHSAIIIYFSKLTFIVKRKLKSPFCMLALEMSVSAAFPSLNVRIVEQDLSLLSIFTNFVSGTLVLTKKAGVTRNLQFGKVNFNYICYF